MGATVRYDTLAVFVGPDKPSGSYTTGDINQLHRIQSSNYGIEIQRESFQSLGTANPNDNVLNSPFVNLSLGYLVSDGQNEKNLGFTVDGQHGALASLYSGEKDYFLLIAKENREKMVLAIGNGALTRYTVNGQINDFLRASVEIRGLNIQLDSNTSGNFVPRVDALGTPNTVDTYELPPKTDGITPRQEGFIESNLYVAPRNILARFPNNSAFGMILSGEGASYLQSFNIEVNLPRSEITEIGAKYPFQRCLQLPVEITLSADFILSNYVADRIQNYLCQDDYDVEIDILQNKCESTGVFWEESETSTKLRYGLKGLKLRNQSVVSSISEKKRVSVQWAVRVGNLLDLTKNFFISGDFGRYGFPITSFRDVSGELGVTGYGLMPFEQEVLYKRIKIDSAYPDFGFEMSGDFDIHAEDAVAPLLYYVSNSGIQTKSGDFGEQIVKEAYRWNSDSYSTIYEEAPSSGFSYRFKNLNCNYSVGYPAAYDVYSGINEFYIKSEAMNSGDIFLSFANLPSYVHANFTFPVVKLDPYKPFMFNELVLGITEPSIPTGTTFEFDVLARGHNFKRAYKVQVTTPHSYHINLPKLYSGRTSFWFEPYDETNIQRVGNSILSVREASVKSRSLVSYSGLGDAPLYQYKELNDKSFVTFGSGSYLNYTGDFLEDFRNFTIFTLARPSVNNSGAELISFVQNLTGSGFSNISSKFTIGQSGDSNKLVIESASPDGTVSGNVAFDSAFSFDTWTINSFVFNDGIVRSKINGVSGQNVILPLTTSGWFSDLTVGKNYEGDIAEIIISPFKFTDDEIVTVENYLRYKWGV